MANHKDALKRIRQNEKRRTRNRHYRSRMRNEIKKLRALVDAGDNDGAKAAFPGAVSVIHRLVTKGVIHRNQAARRVARLSAAIKGM